MAETMHTPGPWAISDYAQDAAIRGACTELVAIVPNRANWRAGVVDDGEREANARLIAAAPAMLDALREAWGLMENRDGPDPCNSVCGSLPAGGVECERKADQVRDILRQALSAAQAGRAV